MGPPGTCGKDGQGVPVGDGVPTLAGQEAHGRRNRSVTDLVDIADRVVGLARPGEQIEAVVVRGLDTEIKVYEGDIESLSSAQSQGVGIRVIADDRQGFAYAGTFDDEVLAETLAEARDNAAFGTPDEFLGLAEPDGVRQGRARPLARRARRLPGRPEGRAGHRARTSGPRRRPAGLRYRVR